jgi:hypothetical protein
MSTKAFKQTGNEPKPKTPPARPNDQLVEEELNDVAGGGDEAQQVFGDGYATCC